MNKKVIIGIAAVVLVAGGVWFFTGKSAKGGIRLGEKYAAEYVGMSRHTDQRRVLPRRRIRPYDGKERPCHAAQP